MSQNRLNYKWKPSEQGRAHGGCVPLRDVSDLLESGKYFSITSVLLSDFCVLLVCFLGREDKLSCRYSL